MLTESAIVIRGGGDLATGVAARLHRSGFRVVVLELARPLAVRRRVALAEAVFAGETRIEDIVGRRARDAAEARRILDSHEIPVLIDEAAATLETLRPAVLVDGRMRKQPSELPLTTAPLVIGLGPGLVAGTDCHAVIETKRGHHLGRVLWAGSTDPDTRLPEPVEGYSADRVLRAPRHGTMKGLVPIGEIVKAGETLFEIDGERVVARFPGALRGLLHDGLTVEPGMKVGDLDPRSDPRYCFEISDKALAVGGGVMEAILSRPDARTLLGL